MGTRSPRTAPTLRRPGLAAVNLAALLLAPFLAAPPAVQASPSTESPSDAQPARRHAGCDTFDAENTPACAGARARSDRAAGPPIPPRRPALLPAPAPGGQNGARPSHAAPSPQAALSRHPAGSRAAPPRAVRAVTVRARSLGAILPRRIWLATGLAALVALAALGGTLWAAARRFGGAAPRATRPTPYRRGLVLSDPDGRSWRIPGHALSPGVCVGSDRASLGYVNGTQIDKRHVEFLVSNGRLLVKRRSNKPTFLNDRSLSATEHSIASTGDRLRLGESDFSLLIE